MARPTGSRSPLIYRCLLRMASWLAPARDREDWRSTREARLDGLVVLVRRGELAQGAGAALAGFLLSACRDAFWQRFDRDFPRRWLRGPAFPFAVAMVATAKADTSVYFTSVSVSRY